MAKLAYRDVESNDVISADTPAEIVRIMNGRSFAPSDTEAAFMSDLAERVEQFSGHTVRTESADTFLADLVNAGLLKEEPIS